jgi:glycosyltransferase involved in cell wall biosynthesis
MKNLPTISVVIPTYNEDKNIKRCLESIYQQKYPKEKLEVIIVDDKSTDKTLHIAKKYPVKIIISGKRHGEISKMIGFRRATGKYAIYLDADVELKGKNWFKKMIKPLEEDNEIVGAFTRKYARKSDPALERYYALDPLQRDSIYKLFSPEIEETIEEKKDGYYLLKYVEGNIPPSGRCLYKRKRLLNIVKDYGMFLELDFLVLLSRNGLRKFAYVPSAGLYHHHAPNLKELIRKRRYNVQKVYLKTINKKLYKWFHLKNPVDLAKIILWVIYANLILPSLIVGIYKTIKHKDWAGMYEPLVNFLVTDVILFSFVQNSGYKKLLRIKYE